MTLHLADIRLSAIPAVSIPFLGILPPDRLRTLFILDGYLGSQKKWEGPAYHSLIGDWLARGLTAEDELRGWLEEKPVLIPFRWKRYERAMLRADEWLREGMQAVAMSGFHVQSPRSPLHFCPRVLYSTGGPMLERLWDRSIPWVALFNSRKSKHVSLREEWLVGLRKSLEHFRKQNIGIAGSIGTLTYDLAAAWAEHEGLPLLLIAPLTLQDIMENPHRFGFVPTDSRTCVTLACRTRSVACAKATCMVCRDRLLAFIADGHWILEVRSGGNLLSVLRNQQSQQPRPQWIMHSKRISARNGGNLQLLEGSPRWATAFMLEEPADASEGPSLLSEQEVLSDISAGGGTTCAGLANEPKEIKWQDYLFHYTRACPGPWPGQSYRDYLLSLLHQAPHAAHSALDTLIRILEEGRIRASAKLVRGSEPVVSWTRVPPVELETIRQWNPALIRWTFEPYGIAVDRRMLRKMGAKPTVYARDAEYPTLLPRERYRFQRHESPDCVWKHEREWRLRKDFTLKDITGAEGFLFVPTEADVHKLKHERNHLPVVVVEPSTTAGRG
jgi:hypothetical protein